MAIKRKGGAGGPDKVELNMTPMIDIVFQLLAFFLMTLNVVPDEGDFNIKMPLAAPREGLPDDRNLPPIKLRLEADSNGNLARFTYNGQPLASAIDPKTQQPDGGFADLQGRIIAYVGNDTGPGGVGANAEVELDCDYRLRYEYVIRAISKVSGYRTGDKITKLIEKIKFAPPRRKPNT